MFFNYKYSIIIFCISLSLSGKASSTASLSFGNKISMGIWRGEILRQDGQKIPFNFQTKETAGKIIIYIIMIGW